MQAWHETIEADSSVCSESVSGLAAVQGDTLLLTKDDDGNECRLTIHRSDNGATAKEDDCTIHHGHACAFDSIKEELPRVR
jgi:hypothetical protein